MNAQAVLCAFLVLSQAMKDAVNFSKTDTAELRELMIDVLRVINARDPSGVQGCLKMYHDSTNIIHDLEDQPMYDDSRNVIHDFEDQPPVIMDPDIEIWSEREVEKKRCELSHEQSSYEKIMNPQEAVTLTEKRKQKGIFKGDITKDNERSHILESPINTNPVTQTSKGTNIKSEHHLPDQSPFETNLTQHNSVKIGEDKSKQFPNGEMRDNNRLDNTLDENKYSSPKMTLSEPAPHQDYPNTHNTCILKLHFARDTNTLGSACFPTSTSDDFPQELPIQVSPWYSDTTDICCDGNPYDHTNRQGYNPTLGHKAFHQPPLGPQHSSSAKVQGLWRMEEAGDEAMPIVPQHQKTKEDHRMGVVEELGSSINRAKQMDWYKKQYRFYGLCPEYFSKGVPRRLEGERDNDNIFDMLLSVFSNYVLDTFETNSIH